MVNYFCIVKITTLWKIKKRIFRHFSQETELHPLAIVFDAEQVFDMDLDFVLSGISSLFFKYIAVKIITHVRIANNGVENYIYC